MKNKQLFEEFIMQNIDGAYRFAFTYTKNKEDAEDVVNESVVKAIKSISSLKNAEYIKTWFYKIIVNTYYTYKKKNSKIIPLDFEDEDEHIVPYCEDDYSNIGLYDMLKVLEEKYRCIIILKFCEEMTFKEISDVLCVGESTVKTRFYKALEILKAELGGKDNATLN